MPDHTFILSSPQVQFCEDVEAESAAQAMAEVGISGYFSRQIEDGEFLHHVEASSIFGDDDLLTVYVFDTETRETFEYQLRIHFTLAGATDAEDSNYIRPEVH